MHMPPTLRFANGAAGAAALAIPVLVVALAIEWAMSALVRRDGRYDWKDTLTSLGLAIGNAVTGKAWGPLAFLAYTLGHRARLFDIPASAPWAWAALFLGDDLCYYWSHRAAHKVPLLWASHVVHHGSPRFNLGIATRNSWTGGLFDWIFWMPLALVGFSPAMIVTMQGLSLIWQFFVHSAYGGRLGPLGALLNTPAHHRVHHARNPTYVDHNFGGSLIIWDRLFGTYVVEREGEPVDYGTREPVLSVHNPFVIAFAGWAALLSRLRR